MDNELIVRAGDQGDGTITPPDWAALDQGNDTLIQLVMLTLVLSERLSLQQSDVSIDVEKWLKWMKDGGARPKHLNKRSADVVLVAQNVFCETLEPYCDWGFLNLADPEYFAFLERVTRPLPGTEPLGPPPQWLRA